MILAPLLPPGVLVAEADPRRTEPAVLFAEEHAQVAKAVAKRAREYGVARTLARPLLKALGAPPGPLLNGPDRAPLWPHGVCGSISHSSCRVAVIAGSRSAYRSLGCDVESAHPLEQTLWTYILREDECSLLELVKPTGLAVRVVFSMKEAVYKAQYPLSGQVLDFGDVRVLAGSNEGGYFIGELMRDAGPLPQGERISGSFRVADGEIAAVSWIPAAAAAALEPGGPP